MERLTEWTCEEWIPHQEKLNGKFIGHRACMTRLAAYEDTGLSPDEINKLNDFEHSLLAILLVENAELKKGIQILEEKRSALS